MVVVLAVKRWRPYFLGAKFLVKTNQRSLKFLLEQRVIQPQYKKWIEKLLGYSFEVIYKLGLENKVTDALSRKPPDVQLCGISVPVIINLKTIKEEMENDLKLQKVIVELNELREQEDGKFSIQNGMLKYKNRLVLSKNSTLIPFVLNTYHDSVVGVHSGFLRTFKRLASELYWEGMKVDVKKHCEECLTCQQNKTLASSPAGLLVPLEIPQQI